MISFGKPKSPKAGPGSESESYKAATRIEDWTLAALPTDYGQESIMVLESECTVPGCPPLVRPA